MTASNPTEAGIVDRLRAAGCVFAEDEARLLLAAGGGPADLAAMVEQRVAGLPLEQVLGWAEFCGLRIAVEPGVFVPRRRTELLVREAIARTPPDAVVLDLCCGSGALGVALVTAAGGAGRIELYAADVHPAAVRCARRNLAPVGGTVFEGDLYEPLPAAIRGRVDILLANVPYVPTGDIGLLPPEARIHEPLVTLDGGADGLDTLRRVSAAAPQWLAPGGFLFSETSEEQVATALAVLTADGFDAQVARCEDTNSTVVIGAR